MRRDQSGFAPGFTLIELLIVIAIIGVLAGVLLPVVLGGQKTANITADALQLRNSHYQWFELYKMKSNRGYPTENGYRFVLATWTSNIADHTVENFDKYFTPGLRDNDGDYQSNRKRVLKGENPWPTLNDTTTQDTHYVGRSKKELKSLINGANEALMATDNEGQWTFPDGDVNILLVDGNVRQLSYMQLQEIYQLGPFDKANPIVTYGPNSPITECQKLDN